MVLNILLIEDDDKLRENLRKSFNEQVIADHKILLEAIGSFEKGIEIIKSVEFDIIILDLFRDKDESNSTDETAGIKVLEEIRKNVFVPVIFFTGHAHKIGDLKSEVVGVVSKGDGIEKLASEIERIINSKLALLKKNIHNHVSEQLRNYFWEIVDSKKDFFIPQKTDFSLGYLLLRRLANSLSKENIKNLLGDDKIKEGKSHPMEFYIYPSNKGEYEAGEILIKGAEFFVVLTPSCDFVTEGTRARKVGQVLLAKAKFLKDTEEFKKYEASKSNANLKELIKIIESRKNDRYFFLPGTPFIENMVLDFQDKTMINYEDLKNFDRIAKLDTPFAQSMISSFIRYYNRIGFPDIDPEYIISKL